MLPSLWFRLLLCGLVALIIALGLGLFSPDGNLRSHGSNDAQQGFRNPPIVEHHEPDRTATSLAAPESKLEDLTAELLPTGFSDEQFREACADFYDLPTKSLSQDSFKELPERLKLKASDLVAKFSGPGVEADLMFKDLLFNNNYSRLEKIRLLWFALQNQSQRENELYLIDLLGVIYPVELSDQLISFLNSRSDPEVRARLIFLLRNISIFPGSGEGKLSLPQEDFLAKQAIKIRSLLKQAALDASDPLARREALSLMAGIVSNEDAVHILTAIEGSQASKPEDAIPSSDQISGEELLKVWIQVAFADQEAVRTILPDVVQRLTMKSGYLKEPELAVVAFSTIAATQYELGLQTRSELYRTISAVQPSFGPEDTGLVYAWVEALARLQASEPIEKRSLDEAYVEVVMGLDPLSQLAAVFGGIERLSLFSETQKQQLQAGFLDLAQRQKEDSFIQRSVASALDLIR